MRALPFFRGVKPYLTAFAVMAMAAVLVGAIYFTLLDLQWIAFLAGVLMAALLAMVARTSRAEWIVARRGAQLAQTREKLATETRLRQTAELALAAARDRLRAFDEALPAAGSAPAAAPGAAAASSEQTMFVNSFSEAVTGQTNAADRIVAALEQDEFRLYYQRIVAVAQDQDRPEHYEILIRLLEEEQNLMPPGAFFPVAEQFGLMPRLDRWVVHNVLQWASGHGRVSAHPATSMFCINLAVATMEDAEFPDYVRGELQASGMPGGTLCFELDESEISARRTSAATFVRNIRELGCHATLCGFGRGQVSIERLKTLGVDFVKIDGSIVLGILRNPVDLAKLTAINRVAQTLGIRTIAEFVESDEIMAKLAQIKVDYAQGFGISRPLPIDELELKDRGTAEH